MYKRQALVHAVEALENAVEVLGRDAYAVVLDAEAGGPAAGFLALFAAGLKRNQTADMGGSVILAEQGLSLIHI